ncbi:unnamed protein product [Spodoptera littoralis]|uniref:Transmembrane protein 131 n=1 Tax=Spodoptera littoralis TaxID=7109 RepID=A0A9P0HW75_SPOLI|nr:unnamed protein product [Spodoptera littoralis]CAH1634960.1 unnamed protein product [Spodoptera littoralis]
MYRKIVWCYVFVLTLLDISLNTKLTAQGKSHVYSRGCQSVDHDTTISPINRDKAKRHIIFGDGKEWGKESGAEGGAGAGRGGRAVAAGALQLSPPALDFGRAALATAHALTVTLTNTANTTMHLASVAGTTPDFHASFFESKTLAPQGNTSFSVVYLGRREGAAAAHLYIHTSLGVHKYPVSAVGVASEWGVWPLLGLRVPLNASVQPLLTLHNPTDSAVQVREVYSSAAWLGLELPGGTAHAPRALWTVAPHSQRALVRLRVAPPAGAGPLTAYVRVRGAGLPGGALLLCVQARAAPAGEYASPLQLRLRPRGSRDAPDVLELQAGNSAAAAVRLQAALWARALRRGAARPAAAAGPASGARGAKSPGVQLSLLQPQLEPHQPPAAVAQLTLDCTYTGGTPSAGAPATHRALCADAALWRSTRRPRAARAVRAARAAARRRARGARAGCGWGAPRCRTACACCRARCAARRTSCITACLYRSFVTANREDALRQREVRVRNEFPVAVHVTRLELAPSGARYWEVESLAPLELAPGADGLLARVRLRAAALAPGAPESLAERLQVATNVTDYSLPLLLYSGRLRLGRTSEQGRYGRNERWCVQEWEWPNSEDGSLRLGAVGTSSTRRVALRLHNPAPAPLCLEPALQLAGASLALDACAGTRAPPGHACRCWRARAAARATLSVVAPAREGALRGALLLWAAAPGADAARALTRAALELSAHEGRVAALPLPVLRAAPYAPARAPLQLECSMALRMQVAGVTLPAREALQWAGRQPAPELGGRQAVGELVWAPEGLGRSVATARRRDRGGGGRGRSGRHRRPVRRRPARRRGPAGAPARAVPGRRAAQRVAARAHDAGRAAAGARHAGAAVAAPGARARARRAGGRGRRAALLAAPAQPVRHARRAAAGRAARRGAGRRRGGLRRLRVGAPGLLAAGLARRARRRARPGRGRGGAARAARAAAALLLAAGAELELRLSFVPAQAAALASYLYLRNNLTVLEPVLLTGRGAYPRFELAGRRPGSGAPLLFEVSSCGGTVRRTVLARNTGPVPLYLRDWRLAGQPCQARGFRLSPCAALALAPNESRPLTLAFSPDYTLARAAADLTARTDTARAAFLLQASAPARLLPRCAAAAPRPPWEPAARAAARLGWRSPRWHSCWPPPRSTPSANCAARAPSGPRPRPRAPRPARARARGSAACAAPPCRAPTPPAAPRRARPARRTPRLRAKHRRRRRLPAQWHAAAPHAVRRREPPPGAPARVPALRMRVRAASGSPVREARRGATARHPARKDKAAKRARSRPASPPRSPAAPRPPAPAALRWGASWSSVVARAPAPTPLAPIGEHVRRREPEPRALAGSGDHSLFYFNGDTPQSLACHDSDFSWRPPPALDRPSFSPTHDFLGPVADEASSVGPVGPVGSGVGRSLSSVWGAGAALEPRRDGPAAAAWLWGGYGEPAVRPPPGFGAPPRPVRPYDPFRSLASIWAPGALDWRPDPDPPEPDQ